jgi:hypothetical protein
MVSNIDPTVPRSPVAYTADMRDNFQAAKTEIEELQDAVGLGSGALDFLPLGGGTLTGPLILPFGSTGNPALEFGSNATGFYMDSATRLILKVGGQVSWIWDPNGPLLLAPFDVDGQRITNVAPATGGTDALNRNTADARYAPVSAAQAIARLEAKVAYLERTVKALSESPRLDIGRGMPTQVLR